MSDSVHQATWVSHVLPRRWSYRRIKHLTTCLDGKRIPLNSAERAEIPGPFPYWGANGVVDTVGDYLFDEPLILLGEDGAPFFDKAKPVAFCVSGKVWVNNHIHVLRPVFSVDHRFLRHWLNTVEYGDFIDGSTRDKLTQGKMANIPVALPPLPIQAAIADFLDRKTAAIDVLIEKKQKLLDLLAEKRAALINQAVTKGLDPKVPMKDSGIPWIGEIPAHWEVMQVRRLLDRLDQGWSPVAEDRSANMGEWAVLKLSAVSKGAFRPDQHKVLLDEDNPRPELTLRQDDLLITRANTPLLVGDACVVKTRHDRLMLSDLIYRLRLNHLVSADYLCLFLISTPGRAPITADARGSSQSMVKVSQSHIKSWPVPLPPYGEQGEIASTINKRLAKLRSIDGGIQMHIERLQEYRQALITAAVTGQLDIPEEAA